MDTTALFSKCAALTATMMWIAAPASAYDAPYEPPPRTDPNRLTEGWSFPGNTTGCDALSVDMRVAPPVFRCGASAPEPVPCVLVGTTNLSGTLYSALHCEEPETSTYTVITNTSTGAVVFAEGGGSLLGPAPLIVGGHIVVAVPNYHYTTSIVIGAPGGGPPRVVFVTAETLEVHTTAGFPPSTPPRLLTCLYEWNWDIARGRYTQGARRRGASERTCFPPTPG